MHRGQAKKTVWPSSAERVCRVEYVMPSCAHLGHFRSTNVPLKSSDFRPSFDFNFSLSFTTYAFAIVLPSQSVRSCRLVGASQCWTCLTFYIYRVFTKPTCKIVVVRRQWQYRTAIKTEFQVFDFEFRHWLFRSKFYFLLCFLLVALSVF